MKFVAAGMLRASPPPPTRPVCLHPSLAHRISSLQGTVFRDERTARPFHEDFAAPAPDALDDHIYLDAMGFGMGCCCLQVCVPLGLAVNYGIVGRLTAVMYCCRVLSFLLALSVALR
jgi:hypothetical protein